MIDYVSAIFKLKHEPFGDILINVDTKTDEERPYRKEVRVGNKSASLGVKSTHDGQCIEVTGNYVKFMQGHNIFGTNDLHGLCIGIIKQVTKQLGIRGLQTERQSIMEGNFLIRRVDIAANFRAADRGEVVAIIREIERHWRDQGKNVSNYGNETVYLDQHNRNVSLKFYNKRAELRTRPLPQNIPARNRLLRYAETLVRAELTLGAVELRKRGLSRGSNWTIAEAKKLIIGAISASGVTGEIKRLLLPDEYETLDHDLKQAYQLWQHGVELRSVFGQSTYWRRRNALRKHGIDIQQPQPKERIVTVDIKSCICLEKMTSRPKFAREHGLIYLPSRRE